MMQGKMRLVLVLVWWFGSVPSPLSLSEELPSVGAWGSGCSARLPTGAEKVQSFWTQRSDEAAWLSAAVPALPWS